ncbi:MAG: sel1 repeat family protein [Nitrospira sp.]|nr:sel1 repeat family protein [Nitrospira sp.]
MGTTRFNVLAVMAFSLAAPAWADYSLGVEAYKRGNYAAAVQEWRVLAEAGHVQAQVSLGWLYLHGRGVAQDPVLARQLFEKAAAQGNMEAQYNLARLYYSGQGGRQDYTQACHWYEKAALQGSADAQVNLGTLYSNGLGCREDDKEAIFWFLSAAKQGHGLAFVKLGSMYEDGRGVTQDYVQAYKWYDLGVRHDEKTGNPLRDELTKRMTPAQVDEAQQLTKEWMAGGP